MISELSSPPSFSPMQQRAMLTALLASLLLHLGLAWLLRFDKPAISSIPIAVSLIRLEPEAPKPVQEQKQQIVSPSEAPEITPKENVNRLSDLDSSTPIEKIRRGLELTTSAASSPTRPVERQKKQTATKLAKAPALRDEKLLADLAAVPLPKSLSGKLAVGEPAEASSKDHSQTAKLSVTKKNLGDYKPFYGRSITSAFDSRFGVPDYLPDVQDGDITLLNAKAYRYAVFVRRVALQVFGALRKHSWHELPYREVQRINGFAEVTAVLDKKGKLLRVKLIDSSGTTSFDKVLHAAARDGAWDQNPPKGVEATDGNIHFVFQARTWSRTGPDGLHEQRWILLRTGLL